MTEKTEKKKVPLSPEEQRRKVREWRDKQLRTLRRVSMNRVLSKVAENEADDSGD